MPAAAPGSIEITARTLEPAGEVTVIELAVTSEHDQTLALDRKQVYARVAGAASGAPALRRSASHRSARPRRHAAPARPGCRAPRARPRTARPRAVCVVLRRGAVTGGGAGGVVGAAVGAIGGVFRGAQDQPPDVAGFEDRALPATALRPGLSASGLLYFPLGDYHEIEVVLVGDEEVIRMIVPVAPPPQRSDRVAASHETILQLEEIAANAVAPEVVQIVDGWVLRAAPAAPFRRSNSVLPIRGDGRGLDDRIALVEEFYRRRGLPVRYQLSPVVAPPELERSLVARGYAVEATSLVQTADASRVVAATARRGSDRGVGARRRRRGVDRGARQRTRRGRVGPQPPRDLRAPARPPRPTERGGGRAPARQRRGRCRLRRGRARLGRHLRHGNASGLAAARRRDRDPARARAPRTGGGARRSICRSRRATIRRVALYARAGFVIAYPYHYRSLDVRMSHG